MIVSFSVENYLSFKEKVIINFQAGIIKEYPENVFAPKSNNSIALLKSIGIFGHNASGKSNFLKAITFMKSFILGSSKESNSSQEIKVQPFLLSTQTEYAPSTFEIIFYIENKKYRYGFSVTRKLVESEWLFYTEKRKETKLFVRARDGYSFEKVFKDALKGKFELFAEVTRINSLFISVLAQFNNKLCLDISNWFDNLLIAHDTAHINLIESTASLMSIGDYNLLINEMIRKSDLGIENVQETIKDHNKKNDSFYDFVSSIKIREESQYSINTKHLKYNKDNKAVDQVAFDLLRDESLGTQKFFGILGPILFALKQQRIIFIDEIDARMHSHLLERIISLFNSNKSNPNGAQLIFTSHNTNLLKKNLRRDQMSFVAKDKFGVSTFGSIYDKDPKVRNDASFDKDYLLGKYGAIPNLGSQLNLF